MGLNLDRGRRQGSINKMFSTWRKQDKFNSFNVAVFLVTWQTEILVANGWTSVKVWPSSKRLETGGTKLRNPYDNAYYTVAWVGPYTAYE